MIHCLIVDDEPIARRVLRAHLARVPGTKVVAECADAYAALRALDAAPRHAPIDLVFLDIEMPGLDGLSLAESLPRFAPARFVFTTAHRHHALRSYDLGALDYLLKPIALPRLLRTLDAYRRQAAPPASSADAPTLAVRADRQTVRVPIPSIHFAESQGDYVTLHTTGGPVTTKLRLIDLADDLAGHGFIRIHRSFVVALAQVEAFTAQTVRVAGRELSIGRMYRDAARDALGAA